MTTTGRLKRAALLAFSAALAAAAGCAGTPKRGGDASTDDPGYLAAGPTVGLDGSGSERPTALELLDKRNRELSAAREENGKLAEERTRLAEEGERLAGEVAELRTRLESKERAAAALETELRSMKESLVRSRLMNVRLSQHLARLDLGIEDEIESREGAAPEPPAGDDDDDDDAEPEK